MRDLLGGNHIHTEEDWKRLGPAPCHLCVNDEKEVDHSLDKCLRILGASALGPDILGKVRAAEKAALLRTDGTIAMLTPHEFAAQFSPSAEESSVYAAIYEHGGLCATCDVAFAAAVSDLSMGLPRDTA